MKAVIAATFGNHAQGLRELRLAQAQLEREDGPLLLIPQTYQFAEIAEWLGRDTRNSAYSAIALNYARAFRLYEPWTAWTYAFEAAYSKDESARLRAAATAMWLDPDSRRLQALPEALRSQAKQWLERHAPFRKARGEMREEKA